LKTKRTASYSELSGVITLPTMPERSLRIVFASSGRRSVRPR
jgi:hypothetical protein